MSDHEAAHPAENGSGRKTGIELHCDDCQQPYGVWYADNEVWNYVMGGPEAKGDPGGMLCPRCFTVRAESCFEQRAIWHLVMETKNDGSWLWDALFDTPIPPGRSSL